MTIFARFALIIFIHFTTKNFKNTLIKQFNQQKLLLKLYIYEILRKPNEAIGAAYSKNP